MEEVALAENIQSYGYNRIFLRWKFLKKLCQTYTKEVWKAPVLNSTPYYNLTFPYVPAQKNLAVDSIPVKKIVTERKRFRESVTDSVRKTNTERERERETEIESERVLMFTLVKNSVQL